MSFYSGFFDFVGYIGIVLWFAVSPARSCSKQYQPSFWRLYGAFILLF